KRVHFWQCALTDTSNFFREHNSPRSNRGNTPNLVGIFTQQLQCLLFGAEINAHRHVPGDERHCDRLGRGGRLQSPFAKKKRCANDESDSDSEDATLPSFSRTAQQGSRSACKQKYDEADSPNAGNRSDLDYRKRSEERRVGNRCTSIE